MQALRATLALLLAGVPVSAQVPGYPTETLGRHPTSVTKDFKAEVVSASAQAQTVTVRKTDEPAAAGPVDITLPVDSSAAATLKELNPGDQVRLVCRTESDGRDTVEKIKRVDTRPPADLPPAR